MTSGGTGPGRPRRQTRSDTPLGNTTRALTCRRHARTRAPADDGGPGWRHRPAARLSVSWRGGHARRAAEAGRADVTRAWYVEPRVTAGRTELH